MQAHRPDLSYGLLSGTGVARHEIERALVYARGNVTHAARKLGVQTRTLQRWIAHHVGLREARDKARRIAIRRNTAHVTPGVTLHARTANGKKPVRRGA